ncbi:hypothetical protein B0O80DRAFT_79853 [Mortierella sp. GBAus27b]|nr:hypothetical protein B0O80DRAFT_79853 [Mortierella sp. GBAus27b]
MPPAPARDQTKAQPMSISQLCQQGDSDAGPGHNHKEDLDQDPLTLDSEDDGSVDHRQNNHYDHSANGINGNGNGHYSHSSDEFEEVDDSPRPKSGREADEQLAAEALGSMASGSRPTSSMFMSRMSSLPLVNSAIKAYETGKQNSAVMKVSCWTHVSRRHVVCFGRERGVVLGGQKRTHSRLWHALTRTTPAFSQCCQVLFATHAQSQTHAHALCPECCSCHGVLRPSNSLNCACPSAWPAGRLPHALPPILPISSFCHTIVLRRGVWRNGTTCLVLLCSALNAFHAVIDCHTSHSCALPPLPFPVGLIEVVGPCGES